MRSALRCHSRESGNPAATAALSRQVWIPAYAGMTQGNPPNSHDAADWWSDALASSGGRTL